MTIDEFNKTKFAAKMTVIYDGNRYTIKQINFHEMLFGLGDDYSDDIYWARCENVVIEKDPSLFEQMSTLNRPQI